MFTRTSSAVPASVLALAMLVTAAGASAPVWHHPPRQVLGAILLAADRPREAEAVYRADLTRFRENGWSLFGLRQSLEAQEKRDEAADVQRRFELAWARADVRLASSRVMDGEPGTRSHAVTEKFADLGNGTTLQYVERGKGAGTPVILLHGFTDSWRSYERVLPLLPDSLHVFAVTLRGHGGSTKPHAGYESRDFARDIASFMDVVGLDRAIIAGHSMGATVAQRFAIEYPQRTMGVILEGAFLPRPGNPAVAELWGVISTFGDQVDPAFVREFQQSTLARPVPREFFELVVGESLKVPARVWKSALDSFRQTDFAAQLANVRVPTLIVWGDRDSFTGRHDQDAIHAAITGSSLDIYAGAGHSPHWEEPERFAARLTAFAGAATPR